MAGDMHSAQREARFIARHDQMTAYLDDYIDESLKYAHLRDKVTGAERVGATVGALMMTLSPDDRLGLLAIALDRLVAQRIAGG